MPFMLPPLPYAKDALAPAISALTIGLHYEKHHRGYVDRLNKITAGTPMSRMPLEDVIAKSWGKPDARSTFDNAAQVWNHNFFWRSMSPTGGKRALGRLGGRIEADFSSYEKFEHDFVEKAVAQFGSGWAWLVLDAGRLKVVTTDDAVTPLVLGLRPLLACDVWEHAYYLDYRNDREAFVRGFLDQLANWAFVEEQLALSDTNPAMLAGAHA
jgi:superoxide dismutase, Fe-Mn family